MGVAKLSKSNPISRRFHAKVIKDAIAAWRSDLDRILHVFNVRSTVSSLHTILTNSFQTELALHTDMAVSDIRHDVASTRGLVSDIHRTMVKGQEVMKNQTVSNYCALFIIEKPLQFPRLKPGSQFQPQH